jgi:CHASE1-domain containing sensor protein
LSLNAAEDVPYRMKSATRPTPEAEIRSYISCDWRQYIHDQIDPIEEYPAMNQRTTSEHPRESVFWPPRLPLVLTVGLGVLFSLTVFLVIRAWEQHGVGKAFRLAAEDRAKAVKSAFEADLAMLEIVRSALISDGRVERQEFHDALAPFLARSNDIWAVEWVPRVADGQRVKFETAARRDGVKDFRFTQLDAGGQFVEAPRRDEYFPIYFIGPQAGHNAAYGYDLASEPTRFEALKTARDTGQTVASGRIAFVQDAQAASGFFVCMPVFEKDRPAKTLADRRRNLMGFVLGVFRPNDMLRSALRRLQPEGIDVGLYDPSAPAQADTLCYHASRLREDAAAPRDPKRLLDPAGDRCLVALDVAGHPWTVVCAPTAAFEAAHRTWWPAGVLAVGLVLTLLAAGYVWLMLANAARLEERVRQQTADIRGAQAELLCRLAAASQCCDEETPQHIRRMGLLSQALARRADWLGEQSESIRHAAPMHDIGKIGIPDAILQKTGELRPEESDVLKTHTRIGAEILAGSNVPMLKMARQIALCHHERWDGQGYPQGLAGNDIPESARIAAIIDAFDTLSHDGPNRSALAESDLLAAMQRESGRQFDPMLLSIFIRHFAEFRRLAAQHPDRGRSGVRQPPARTGPTIAPIVLDPMVPGVEVVCQPT